MLPIKRLYTYILQAFLPVFFMTFGICLFILLMQFLWKYVEDLVGKGLDTLVLAEFFLYAILFVLPLALPLAILLASLMTFGSLGERFELLAIKAAGISLLKSMLPLIIVVTFISIGAFFFQNEAMPKINVKTTSLLRSIKMKSPELDIPEGSFYNEIDNYNLYVKSKNKKTGMLYGVKIYDISKGFDNMGVIVCDSAKMRMSSGKDYLLLSLYNGQQFANFQKPGAQNFQTVDNKFIPYGRENFLKKEIVIQFDATFSRVDESSLQGTQIAKNIKELQASIDSISQEVDSLNVLDRTVALRLMYKRFPNQSKEINDRENKNEPPKKAEQKDVKAISPEFALSMLDLKDLSSVYSDASSQSEMNKSDLMFRSMTKIDAQSKIRQHNVEWHRKFTLSFACLIFFFIGAPLGAIIRKGGLGMPVVASVILFIIYYIFDNVGRKMARDGVWDVWQGIWLSSFILFPLGVFLTYKAMNDSALFNTDAYRNYYNRLFGDPALKTPKQLILDNNRNTKYTFIIYLIVIILVAAKILLSGILLSITNVLLIISVVAYILSFLKTYIELKAFYKSVNYKAIFEGLLFFGLGLPFFFAVGFYYNRSIKKIYESFESKINKQTL